MRIITVFLADLTRRGEGQPESLMRKLFIHNFSRETRDAISVLAIVVVIADDGEET